MGSAEDNPKGWDSGEARNKEGKPWVDESVININFER